MKKTLLAAALVMVSGSALAVDGGHIDFNGLVQSGTCKVGVVDAGMARHYYRWRSNTGYRKCY